MWTDQLEKSFLPKLLESFILCNLEISSPLFLVLIYLILFPFSSLHVFPWYPHHRSVGTHLFDFVSSLSLIRLPVIHSLIEGPILDNSSIHVPVSSLPFKDFKIELSVRLTQISCIWVIGINRSRENMDLCRRRCIMRNRQFTLSKGKAEDNAAWQRRRKYETWHRTVLATPAQNLDSGLSFPLSGWQPWLKKPDCHTIYL